MYWLDKKYHSRKPLSTRAISDSYRKQYYVKQTASQQYSNRWSRQKPLMNESRGSLLFGEQCRYWTNDVTVGYRSLLLRSICRIVRQNGLRLNKISIIQEVWLPSGQVDIHKLCFMENRLSNCVIWKEAIDVYQSNKVRNHIVQWDQ